MQRLLYTLSQPSIYQDVDAVVRLQSSSEQAYIEQGINRRLGQFHGELGDSTLKYMAPSRGQVKVVNDGLADWEDAVEPAKET